MRAAIHIVVLIAIVGCSIRITVNNPSSIKRANQTFVDETTDILILSTSLLLTNSLNISARMPGAVWATNNTWTLQLSYFSPTSAVYVVEERYQAEAPRSNQFGQRGMNWQPLEPKFTNGEGINVLTLAVPPWERAFFRVRRLP